MNTTTMTPSRCRGRARGIVLVSEGEQKQQLQINNYLPGWGRAETLKNLADMAEKEDCRPRDKHSTQVFGSSYHMESIRTRWRQAIPHSQGEEPPRQPCL